MKPGWLPPVIAAAVTLAMVVIGAREETYDLDVAFHCSHEVAVDDRAAADILLVGNSQTGASIDQIYLNRLLGEDISVEKLSLVQANIVALRMLVDDYVQHRGSPDIVVLQPMVVRAEHWQQAPGRPVHPRVNVAYQDWDELVAIQKSARLSPVASPLPAWVAKDYRTVPALWVDRQVERVIAFLGWPRKEPVKASCDDARKWQLSPMWPYDTLPLAEGDDPGDTMDDKAKADWANDIAQRKAADVSAPERTFEIDQLRQLIGEIEVGGSRVILVGYPNMGEADQDAADFADFSGVLGREVVDLRTLLTEDERERIEASYRDPLHLNFAGAEIITRRMAELLADRPR